VSVRGIGVVSVRGIGVVSVRGIGVSECECNSRGVSVSLSGI
jgi:hypothetical protein